MQQIVINQNNQKPMDVINKILSLTNFSWRSLTIIEPVTLSFVKKIPTNKFAFASSILLKWQE